MRWTKKSKNKDDLKRIQAAARMLDSSKASRERFIDAVNPSYQSYRVDQIMKTILATQTKQGFPNLLFKNVKAYTGVLAGVFIVVVVAALFHPASVFNKTSPLFDSNSKQQEMYQDDHRQNAVDQTQSPSYTGQPYPQEGNTDTKNGTGLISTPEGAIPDSVAEFPGFYRLYGLIGYPPEHKDTLMSDLLHTVETSTTAFSYIGISIIESDKITPKETQIRSLLHSYNIHTEIEIIAGDDRQKLLEYIHEDTLAILDSYSTKIAADYLVIFIER